MLDRQVEGLIFATWFHRRAKLPPIVRQLPNVLVDCYVEDRSLPSVVPDEFQGGYTAAELLLRQGHRRIGFINNNEDQPARWGRQQGYVRALADGACHLTRSLSRFRVAPPKAAMPAPMC